MSFLRIVFCCLTIYNISEGKIVQGIIGRNVSFSWTFKTIKNDDVFILHNESRFHQVVPLKNLTRPRTLLDRVRISVSYTATDNMMVTVDILNITENDAGKYRVVREWKSQDLDDSVHLKTIDETIIPKIVIVGHNMLNSTLVLECRFSSPSAVEFFWSANGSMIGNHGKYSPNNTFLSIRNLTVDDQYNLYKCNESGSGLESDPYSIKISGPNAIKFTPHITMVQEYSGLNVSCLADCYPICSWKWTKLNVSLGQDQVISSQNALHIQNITRQDSGMYSCRVLNKITGISVENLTPIHIVYGPGVISFNSSDKIIQMDEKDSITISCSADCFPPCQIDWTETNAEILMPDAELKLVNVNRNSNYTCHATNAIKDNATITDTIYVIVKSGTNHYTTTAMASQEDAEEFPEFPSKRHLLYILLGIGITLAVALLACLLHKIRTGLRADRVSIGNILTDYKKDDGGENLQEEIQSSSYWTIVSNADGELSSAIETEFERRREQQPMGQNIVSIKNESKQPLRPDDVDVNEELDGYLNPIQSRPVELDDYIHPIHSDPVNSGFVPTRRSTEF